MRSGLRLVLLVASVAASGCTRVSEPPAPDPTPRPRAVEAPARTKSASTEVPTVLGRTPHDPAAFTQGLVFAGGSFLESTGRYGESSLRRVDPATGRVMNMVRLSGNVFAEGLARLRGELFQLTWREHVCFVYDEATLAKRRELAYDGEGWGLTTDGDALLVMSDGSSTLRFMDPASFATVRTIVAHEGSRPIEQLNELEWVRGEILANVWLANVIVRIDPRSGDVLGYLDLTGIPEPRREDPDAVLNGIAYDERGDRLFVTGKLWSAIYEIARPGR